MDRLSPYAGGAATRPDDAEPRAFLFLQGPISPFFDRLGRALVARGHRVRRINLHLGDRLFWRLPSVQYRGRLENWRAFVGAYLDREGITDLVIHGDRRPYHIIAAEEARARGIAVLATDLGYVRPDWLTLEYDGLTTYSRFPRDPAAIRALAARFPEPDLEPRFHTPFALIAAFDIAYNLGLVFGRPLYPHYRYHSICHPFAEYAGWINSRTRRFLAGDASARATSPLPREAKSYFVVPLQIATDFQLRAHSRYTDQRDAVRDIIASFARSGSRRRLAFFVHPLDNGLIDWPRIIARLAREYRVGDLVEGLLGGTPAEILRNAAGVITINSTVGTAALYHGVPVKALGNAIYDVDGLTCQAPLDMFWQDPPAPDPALLRDFVRALVGTTQVKGGYYERSSLACAVAGFVDRLEPRPFPLPPPGAAELAARQPRPVARTVAVLGVSGTLGAALARARAMPGVKLHLIDASAAALSRIAEDCRYRGAVVETHQLRRGAELAPLLSAIQEGCGIDVLIAAGDGGALSPAISQAARDLFGAMDAVAAVSGGMRRRGRGEIVLAGGAAGQPATVAGPQAAARAAAALRAYA
ncbi:MAG TPA: capsular biosynthesis protein, partial [Stellaceae bacterium]|nr:capsular biosynthesis protein [Stellaceae bacterium]